MIRWFHRQPWPITHRVGFPVIGMAVLYLYFLSYFPDQQCLHTKPHNRSIQHSVERKHLFRMTHCYENCDGSLWCIVAHLIWCTRPLHWIYESKHFYCLMQFWTDSWIGLSNIKNVHAHRYWTNDCVGFSSSNYGRYKLCRKTHWLCNVD